MNITLSADLIPARVYNTYRCGIFFNVGWLTTYKKEINLNEIYKVSNEPPIY